MTSSSYAYAPASTHVPTILYAPKDGYYFTDAASGDLLVSTSNALPGLPTERVLIGSKKWDSKSAILIDESNAVAVHNHATFADGVSLRDGRGLHIHDGGDFIMRDAGGAPVLSVDQNRATMNRSFVVGCNVSCGGDATIAGDVFVGRGLLSTSVEDDIVRVGRTDVTDYLVVRGEVDAVGSVLVRPALPGGRTADKTKPVICKMNDAGIALNRVAQVDGGLTVVNGETAVKHGLKVKAHGVDVLRALADSNDVEMLRPVVAHNGIDVQGNFQVAFANGAGSNLYSSTSPSNLSSVLRVHETAVYADRELRVADAVTLSTDGVLRVPGASARLVTDGFEVDAAHARTRRDVFLDCNLDVAGATTVTSGSLTVLTAGGPAQNELWKVTDAGVVASRPLSVTGGFSCAGDVKLVGDLSVRPSGSAAPDDALFADATSVAINRPVHMQGDATLRGELVVRRQQQTAVVAEPPLFSVTDRRITCDRQVELACNLTLPEGAALCVGTGFSVSNASLSLAGALDVARDVTSRGAGRFADGVSVGCNLIVYGAGVPIAQAAPALIVSDSNIEAARHVVIAGDLDVRRGGHANIAGDLHVAAGAAGPVLSVNAHETRLERHTQAMRDVTVRGGLEVSGAAGLAVSNAASVDGPFNAVRDPTLTRHSHVFRVDTERVAASRPAEWDCNVTVRGAVLDLAAPGGALQLSGGGDVVLQGGDLRVQNASRSPDGTPASPQNVLWVRNNALLNPQDPVNSPIDVPGHLSVAIDAFFDSNLTVKSGFDVDGDASVGGTLDVASNFTVANGADTRLEGALEVVSVLATDAVGTPSTLFRVSEADGVLSERDTVVRGQLRTTKSLAVAQDVAVDGRSELRGDLYVRPGGAAASAAFVVRAPELTAARDVHARCNLCVDGGTRLRGDLDVEAADVRLTDGALTIDPGSGRAFAVTDDAITVRRPLDAADRVSVSNVLDVKDDATFGKDARVLGDLYVRPAGAAISSSLAPTSTSSSFAVTDAIVRANRDARAACNFTVDGPFAARRGARLSGAPTDVTDVFRVFPGVPSGVDTGGIVRPAFLVSDSQIDMRRDVFVSDRSVVVGSNLTVGEHGRVGGDLVVERNAAVTKTVTSADTVTGVLRVTGSTDMVGPLTIRPERASGTVGLSLTDVRLRVDRDVTAACNVSVASNLVVGERMTVKGGAHLRSDVIADGALSLARTLDVGGRVSASNGLDVTGDVTVRGGDTALYGDLVVAPSSSTSSSSSPSPAPVLRVFSSNATGMRVAKTAEFLENLVVSSNLHVGNDVSVARTLRANADVSAGRDVNVANDLRVTGGAEVVHGSTALRTPTRVRSSDGSDTVVLKCADGGLTTTGTFTVHGAADVSGPLTLRDGALLLPTSSGAATGGLLNVRGSADVSGDLEVAGGLRLTGGGGAAYLSTPVAHVGEGGLTVKGRTELRDEFVVNDDGGVALAAVNASNVVLRPDVYAMQNVTVRGALNASNAASFSKDVAVDGTLTVAGPRIAVSGDLGVGGTLSVGQTGTGAGSSNDAQHYVHAVSTSVRKFQDAYRDVCEVANATAGAPYGGGYVARVDVVFDQREAKTYVVPVGRNMTGGAWRLCLPLADASELAMQLQARSSDDVTTFRVVNTVANTDLANFGSNNDDIYFTFVLTLTNNVNVPLSIADLTTEGSLTAPVTAAYPSTALTQRVDVKGGNGARVGVNVLAPLEGLDVLDKVQARDQFLSYAGGTAAVPAFSFAASESSNTGVFLPSPCNWAISTDGAERLRVTDGGRIGVGLVAPTEVLDVGGKVRARDQIVAETGTETAPSFSFASDSNTGVFRPSACNLAIATRGSERLRVTSAGDVGVGVSRPTERLDVENKVRARDQFLGFTGGGSNRPAFSFASDSNTGVYGPRPDALALATGGVEQVRVIPSGNVGVGLENPVENLDVRGKVRARDQFLGVFDGTAGAPAYSFAGDSNTGAFRPSPCNWAVATAGAEAYRVAANGFIGVGLTAPQEEVDVRHKIQARDQFLGFATSTAAHPAYSFTGDTSTGVFLPAQNAWAVTTAGAEHLRVSAVGNVGINVQNPQEALDVGQRVQARNQFLGFQGGTATDPAYSFTLDTNTGVFRPAPDAWAISTAGQERVRVIHNGDVAVAHCCPDERVDVAGKTQSRDQFLGFPAGSAAAPAYSFTGDSNTGVFTPANDAWAVATGGAEHVRVAADGKVGLDVTAPQENLDVAQKVRARNQFLGFTPTANPEQTPSYSFAGDADTGMYRSSANRIGFSTAGNERIQITPDGRVIVRGVLAQYEPLMDVAGAIRSSSRFVGNKDDTTVTPSFTWDQDLDTGMYRPATNALALTTGGTERLRVISDGKVGIGQVAPTELLQVKGNARAERFLGDVGSSGKPAYSFTADQNTGMYQAGANVLAMATVGTERMRIDSGGQVFINHGSNLAPGTDCALKVNGRICAANFVNYQSPTTAHNLGKVQLGGVLLQWGVTGNSKTGTVQFEEAYADLHVVLLTGTSQISDKLEDAVDPLRVASKNTTSFTYTNMENSPHSGVEPVYWLAIGTSK